jgi:hypothetical protein
MGTANREPKIQPERLTGILMMNTDRSPPPLIAV